MTIHVIYEKTQLLRLPLSSFPKKKAAVGWQFSSLWSLEEQKSLLPAPEQQGRVPARAKEAASPQRPRSLSAVSPFLPAERRWVPSEAAGGSGRRHPPLASPKLQRGAVPPCVSHWMALLIHSSRWRGRGGIAAPFAQTASSGQFYSLLWYGSKQMHL